MTIEKRLLRRYTRFRWHRCLLVEAMRVIAFRNMDHMYVTRVALGVSDWADPDTMDRVLDKILLDQGMDLTKEHRWVLGWGSRASWEVYMCMLYAGIEQYGTVSRKHPEFSFGPLDEFLHRNRTLVEHLGAVRDKLLHPLKDADYGDNLRDVGMAARHTAPDLFLALERLNNQLDDFLEHFKNVLDRSLEDEITGLPVEALVAYCRGRAKTLASAAKATASIETQTRTRRSLDELNAIERSVGLDAGCELALTGAQSSRVHLLQQAEEALRLPLPKRPYQKSKESVQTPVAPELAAWMLLSSFGGRVAELEERLPGGVFRHRSGLLELLVRSIVIYNEIHVALVSRFGKVFPDVPFETFARNEDLWQEASRRSIPTEWGADLEQAMVEAAPFRIALGLLTEPLRIYDQVIQQHPELMRREIDNDTLDETLNVFRALRNSIFHVPDGQADVFEADRLVADASTSHGDYLDVAGGLVQFFQGRNVPVGKSDR